MNPWLLSAAAMLVCAAPVAAVLVRGHLMSALIAYEMVSSVAVMELVLVGEGFDRSGEFELPVLLA
ncbi:MAG TPA: hypothetical protein VFN61_02830, partial [Acidimicrobiales bacterium]|nr:hypothetical protein [Acidimicrobiales bacterium]